MSDEHATLTCSLDTVEGNVCEAQSNARCGSDVGEERVEDAIAVEQLDFDLELLLFGLLLFVLFLVGRGGLHGVVGGLTPFNFLTWIFTGVRVSLTKFFSFFLFYFMGFT